MASNASFGDQRTLSELHSLVTDARDTGNGIYITARHYKSGDVEVVGLKLNSDDSLRRGGGAKRNHDKKDDMNEVVLAKSISRARTNVRRMVMSMDSDRMLTLTFRENVQDIDEAWQCLKYFHQLMRAKYGAAYKFVVVPEYQKRGAVHFHLALNRFFNVRIVRAMWLRAAGHRQGNIDITSPKQAGKQSWNAKRIANYIAKYLSKTDSVEFNRRRYATGGKIELPLPKRGWLALGFPVASVLMDIINQLTTFPVRSIWESENYFFITYAST